jgi:hypothetical protein
MWSSIDLTVGIRRESIADIALALAGTLQIDPALRPGMEACAQARLGLYRATWQKPPRSPDALPTFRVVELVTEHEIDMQFAEPLPVEQGELLLMRLHALPEAAARARGVSHIASGTPYVLEGRTDIDWLEYLERAAGSLKLRLDPESYARVMRGEGDERRWLEFVFVGYGGVREGGVVEVVGIPDRPDTLPHHGDFDPALQFVVPKGTPTRERATILCRAIADKLAPAIRSLDEAWHAALERRFAEFEDLGGARSDWADLVHAVMIYEQGPDGGPALLARVDGTLSLDDDQREYIAASRDGWTSLFEVVSVERGQSLRIRDLLGEGEVEVQERSGTLHMPTRVCLLGRVVHYRGVHLFDAIHTRPFPPQLRDRAVAEARKALRVAKGSVPRERLSARIFELMKAWQRVSTEHERQQTNAPAPVLVTTTGEPLEFSRATFSFPADARAEVVDAVARLRGCLQDGDDDDSFVILRGDIVEARVSVAADSLTIEAHARERLARVERRLRSKLGRLLGTPDRSFETAAAAMASSVPRVHTPKGPEANELIRAFLQDRYTKFLDESIPSLGGLTPRQAARDPRARAALDTLLREHEFHTTRQLRDAAIDFDAMRRELGLE